MTNAKKNIVLIGMPGCGKSTIGKEISKLLQGSFYDTDSLIEQREKESISELFSNGEDYFRIIETQIIYELSSEENCVISTGGGVVKREENIKLLKHRGLIVFINRSLDNILGDIDVSTRPLLLNKKENLIKLYDERIHLYKKFSDIEISNNAGIENTVENILSFYKERVSK